MNVRRTARTFLATAAMAVIIASCSASDSSSDSAGPTSTSTEAPEATSGAPSSAAVSGTTLVPSGSTPPPFDEEAVAEITPPSIPPLEPNREPSLPRNGEVPLPALGPGVSIVLPPSVDPGVINGTDPVTVIDQVIDAIIDVQPDPGPLPPYYADLRVGDLEPWAIPDPAQSSVSCALVRAEGLDALLGEHRIFQDSEFGMGNCFAEALEGRSRVFLHLGYVDAGTPLPPPYEGVVWQRSDYGGVEVFSSAQRGVLTAVAVRADLVVYLTALDESLRIDDREGLLAAMAASALVRLDPEDVRGEIERFAELLLVPQS